MTRSMQYTLFGGVEVSGNIVDKLTAILEDDPGSRSSYRRVVGRYWIEYDGLAGLLGEKADLFLEWLEQHATSPKTLQNRCMEIQNARPDLRPPENIQRWREAQSHAGPVK